MCVGGNTPWEVYYHQYTTELRAKEAKKVQKYGQKGGKSENTYLILATFGDIWWPDCLPTVPHLFTTGVSTKRQGGMQRTG